MSLSGESIGAAWPAGVDAGLCARAVGPRLGWYGAVAVSIAAHAIVGGVLSTADRGAAESGPALATAPAIHLRLSVLPGAPRGGTTVPDLAQASALAALSASAPAPPQASHAVLPGPADVLSRDPVTEPHREAKLDLPTVVVAGRGSSSSALGAEAVDGYVLRKALTRPPVPLSDLSPPWPAGLSPAGPQSGVFSVFINDDGAVDRLVPDGPTLWPPLEASARSLLMATRFKPGEVDGHPVKALIRIEVLFDSRPADAPRPVVVSRQNL